MSTHDENWSNETIIVILAFVVVACFMYLSANARERERALSIIRIVCHCSHTRHAFERDFCTEFIEFIPKHTHTHTQGTYANVDSFFDSSQFYIFINATTCVCVRIHLFGLLYNHKLGTKTVFLLKARKQGNKTRIVSALAIDVPADKATNVNTTENEPN